MNASINNIRPGTANTFEHLASNFKLRVVGDGKVEPEIADRFKSASLLEDVSDRRLRAFAASHQELRQANLPYEESLKSTEQSLLATLGVGWAIDSLYAPGAADGKGTGISRLQLRLGGTDGSQSLSFQRTTGGGAEFALETACQMNGWSVTHRIAGEMNQGAIQSDTVVESATFKKPD